MPAFLSGVKVKTGGTKATMGKVTLAAGAAVVNTTAVTAASLIFLTGQTSTVGELHVFARVAGTSFTIHSSYNLDSSDVAWWLIEPA